MALTVNRGRHGRRITRLLFPLLPFHYALSRPAEHRLPFPVLLPHAEERGRHGPLRRRIPLPDQLAGLEIEANQFALGAEGVTTISRQQRRAARAVIVAVGILKMARISV